MDEQSEKLAGDPVPEAPVNRGWFRPGDQRINKGGRPRKPPPGVHPADCAGRADRVLRMALPAGELAWRLANQNGFWLVNLPPDVEIVAARVDAGRVVFVIRSREFPLVARGALIPEFKPAFNGLRWRRDWNWRP